MANIGKRTLKAREGVDPAKAYPLPEAVKMVKDRAKAKFDETIEIAMNLGVDPKHADQMVRGVVTLPNGTGRTVRVGVFARGPKAEPAPPYDSHRPGATGISVAGSSDIGAWASWRSPSNVAIRVTLVQRPEGRARTRSPGFTTPDPICPAKPRKF